MDGIKGFWVLIAMMLALAGIAIMMQGHDEAQLESETFPRVDTFHIPCDIAMETLLEYDGQGAVVIVTWDSLGRLEYPIVFTDPDPQDYYTPTKRNWFTVEPADDNGILE